MECKRYIESPWFADQSVSCKGSHFRRRNRGCNSSHRSGGCGMRLSIQKVTEGVQWHESKGCSEFPKLKGEGKHCAYTWLWKWFCKNWEFGATLKAQRDLHFSKIRAGRDALPLWTPSYTADGCAEYIKQGGVFCFLTVQKPGGHGICLRDVLCSHQNYKGYTWIINWLLTPSQLF